MNQDPKQIPSSRLQAPTCLSADRILNKHKIQITQIPNMSKAFEIASFEFVQNLEYWGLGFVVYNSSPLSDSSS